MKKCILIIEDDVGFLNRVKRELEANGYLVIGTSDGVEGLTLAKQQEPDLVILDLRLDTSTIDGWEICRSLRKLSQVPILITTGSFVRPSDIVRGLELGADDYLCKQSILQKPISLKELLARVRAILRRTEWQTAPSGTWAFGDVVLDFHKLEATRAGKPVKLRPMEFGILRLLIEHEGEPVTRDRLLDEVWGYDRYPTQRTVDTHIYRLRRLLEDNPKQPRYIQTVPVVGYRFVDGSDEGESG